MAQAKLVTITFTGTVAFGIDTSGVFGLPSSYLNGQAFTLVFTVDDTAGVQNTQNCPGGLPYSSSITNTANSNPATAVLTIGSGSFTFGKQKGRDTTITLDIPNCGTLGSQYSAQVQDLALFAVNNGVEASVYGANGTPLTTNTSWEAPFSISWTPFSGISSFGAFSIADGLPAYNSAFASLNLQSITVNGGPGSCPVAVIAAPPNGFNSQLDEGDYTSKQISFTANGLVDVQTAWTANLQYQTSQGSHSFTSMQSFTSPTNTPVTQNFASMGGKVTVTAQTSMCLPSPSVTGTITGSSQLPPNEITSFLLSLYQNDPNAFTPNLLSQIATAESTLEQFCLVDDGCNTLQTDLYGLSGLWPKESSGASHIGLMQVVPTMLVAWDWKANATSGRDLLDQKFGYMRQQVTAIRSTRPGLPAMTAMQLENMAIMQYGAYPGRLYSEYYYVAACDGVPANYAQPNQPCAGTWSWIINATSNQALLGEAYVANVRNQMP